MYLQKLIDQLRSSQPTERLQALQVLALVEETAALPAILELYKNDPDPKVQKAAKWAGSLIWQASQRGYQTPEAIHDHFNWDPRGHSEAWLVERLTLDPGKDEKARNALESAQSEWERIDTLKSGHQNRESQEMRRLAAEDPPDVLESGLSEAFRWLNQNKKH